MGRPKSYDREVVLAKAMALFWERGFHATSTRELAEAMGVNPFSLYAEFGSKEALYDAAIERYMDTVVTGHFGRLEAPGADLDDVRCVIDWFGDNGLRDTSGMGCLIGSMSTERAPTVDRSREHTARFVDRLVQAFTHAIDSAVVKGQLAPDTPAESIAVGFAAHLLGLFAMSRARVAPGLIRAASDWQLACLDAWAMPDSPAASQSPPPRRASPASSKLVASTQPDQSGRTQVTR